MAEMNAPLRMMVTGEVIDVKEMLKENYKKKNSNESKFKHDCYLVTVDPLNGNPMVDVYVTFAQWDKYGMSAILFEGNIVNVIMDQCIAGETTYYDENDEIQYHTASYNSFAGAKNVGETALIGVFMKQGLVPSVVKEFINCVVTNRNRQKAKISNPGAAKEPVVSETGETSIED